MTNARIELPPKLIPVFAGEADVRGAYGGRGSGKTRSFALMSAVYGYRYGMRGVSGIIQADPCGSGRRVRGGGDQRGDGMRLSIQTNFPVIQRELDRVSRELRNTVIARSLNRTMDQARTQMVREITKEFAVTAGYVRDRLRVRRAFAKGQLNIEASLSGSAKNRAANVIAFQARQTKKGVTVRISRSGGRKLIRSAFIGNKGRTVFARQEDTRMASRQQYRGKHAEKIAGVQTIDIPQMFTTRRINDAVMDAIRERFPKTFARELRFALGKFQGAGK